MFIISWLINAWNRFINPAPRNDDNNDIIERNQFLQNRLEAELKIQAQDLLSKIDINQQAIISLSLEKQSLEERLSRSEQENSTLTKRLNELEREKSELRSQNIVLQSTIETISGDAERYQSLSYEYEVLEQRHTSLKKSHDYLMSKNGLCYDEGSIQPLSTEEPRAMECISLDLKMDLLGE